MAETTGELIDGLEFGDTVSNERLAELIARAIEIDKPAPADAVEYTIGAGQVVKFNFPLDDVEVVQTDTDIILIFQDEAQIAFPSLVASALAEAPPLLLLPDDVVLSAAEFLELGADISEVAKGLGDLDPAAGGGADTGTVSAFAGPLFDDGLQIGNDIPVSFVAGGPLGLENVPVPVPPPLPQDPVDDLLALPPIGTLAEEDTIGEIPPIDTDDGDTLDDDTAVAGPSGDNPVNDDDEPGDGEEPGDNEEPNSDTIPEILPADDVSLNEGGLASARAISVAGEIPVTFGEDGPAQNTPLSFTQAGVDALNALGLRSVGEEVTVFLNPDGRVLAGLSAGGDSVFTIRITEEDGGFGYTFEQQRALNHDVAVSDGSLELPFQVAARDGDGSTTDGLFTVRVIDASPAIALDPAAGGEEDTLVPLELASAIRIDTVEFGTLEAIISGVPDGARLVGGANEVSPGAWSVSENAIDTVALEPPDHFSGDITLTLDVTVTDSDGDTARSSVDFTVFVAPVADRIAAGLSEAGALFELDEGASVAALPDAFRDRNEEIGTTAADSLTGTEADDLILGGAGDDILSGAEGDDVLIGDGDILGGFTAPLAISVSTPDDDGSEVQSVEISDIPEGAVLTNAAGEVFEGISAHVLSPGQLDGLEISVPQGTGDFDLTLRFVNVDTAISGGVPVTDEVSTLETLHVAEPTPDGSFDDTISGGEGDDVIYGDGVISGPDGGDDIIRAGAGEDIVHGGGGRDVIFGGANTPATSVGGEGAAPFRVTQFTELGEPGFKSSFGYYITDESGAPLEGRIIWADVQGDDEAPFDPSEIELQPGQDFGFFVVPLGNTGQNMDLVADGEDVAFETNADGLWQVLIDGVPLSGQGGNPGNGGGGNGNGGSDSGNPGNPGNPAYFSGAAQFDPNTGRYSFDDDQGRALNSDGEVHVVVNLDGTIGFEDSRIQNANANEDFEDVILGIGLDPAGEIAGEVGGGDTLAGGADRDFIVGGSDGGDYTTSGSITLTATGSSAGYSNSVGYFTTDDEGNPVAGVVVWANVKEHVGESLTFNLGDGIEPANVGLFIIPNGARRNRDLEDNTEVTFQRNEDGGWVVVADGSPLSGHSGNPAYFSVAALNPDGADHFRFGEDGSVGIEDLPIPRGDGDFNDVELTLEPGSLSFEFVGGDQLWGGDIDAAESDGTRDIFYYSRGDGVDTIHDFEVGTDQLFISGYDRDDLRILQDGEDTIVALGDGGAVKLVGVDADVFGAAGNIADYDADLNGNGTLGIDDLVELKDDILGDDGGADGQSPPPADDVTIVLVATTEPGLTDSGGDEPTL